MRKSLFAIPIVFVVAVLDLGCTPVVSESHPFSVVLITVDTRRPDRLGTYGYARARTPAIDEFASEGALFENVYCDVPWTTASVASIVTGLFNTEHGLQAPWLRPPEDQTTMAEVFGSHGYKTGAVVGIFSLDAVYGLDQSFDFYDDDFSLPAVVLSDHDPANRIDLKISDDLQEYAQLADAKMKNDAYKTDGAVTDSALEWLDQNKGEPFLLWAHYFGPHERLIFVEGARDNRRRIIADYDRDLANTRILRSAAC
jgi:arylsulfatase A-like enzyme